MNKPIKAPSVDLRRATSNKIIAPDGAELLWQPICYAGRWEGYAGGTRSFEFSRETFETMISNFRKNPRYSVDHSTDVIRVDISHHSELPASDQPQGGAEIVGWCRELRIVQDGGRDQLEALTRWLPRGKELVASGQYPWASVSVIFDSTDLVTGESIGPELSSFAITPDPFLQELPKLAASRGANIPPKKDSTVIDLTKYPGANDYERALAHVRQQPGGSELSYDDAFRAAHGLVKSARAASYENTLVCQQIPDSADPRPVLDIRTALGRNTFEKVMAALERELGDQYRRLSFGDRHRLAARALRERRIVEG